MMRRKDDTNLRIKKELEGKIRDDIQSIPEELHITERRHKNLYQSSVKNTRAYEFDDFTNFNQPPSSASYSTRITGYQSKAEPNIFERGPRIEMLALREDLHNPHKKTSLPINEWVPPLGLTGGTGGPRQWPNEASETSCWKNSFHKDPYDAKPSYARETTVTRSALQNALFSNGGRDTNTLDQQQDYALAMSAMMRGTQRIAQKEANKSAILLTDALEERKQHQLQHADWLISSSISPKKQGKNLSTGRKNASYGAEQCASMGVSAAPNTVYRNRMRTTGSGIHKNQLSKHSKHKKIGQLSVSIKPSHNEKYDISLPLLKHDAMIENAISKKQKSRTLQFIRKISSTSQCLKIIQNSFGAHPGNQDLLTLHLKLRKCGNENSDPLLISRNQFLFIMKKRFSHEIFLQHGKKFSDFFSCFDPLNLDRVRFDSLIAALMLANRPDVYKLIGFISVDCHNSYFSDLLPVLKAIFELYGSKDDDKDDNNQDVSSGGSSSGSDSQDKTSIKNTKNSLILTNIALVSADDCRDFFLLCCLNEDDYFTMDSLWSVASVDLFQLRPRSKSKQINWNHFLNKLEKQPGTPVLSEYHRQVIAYQEAVKNSLVQSQTK